MSSTLRGQLFRYRALVLAAAVALLLFAIVQRRASTSRSSSDEWYLHPTISVIARQHIDLQRHVYGGPTPVAFAIHGEAATCSGAEVLRGALEDGAWYTVALGGQLATQCGGEAIADATGPAHSLFFAEARDVGELRLEEARPTCKACSSTLLIARAPTEAEAEAEMDALLDTAVPWTILRDVQSIGDGGFVFALRRLPMPVQEQRHYDDFLALQDDDSLECEDLTFLVHEMMPSGLGSVVATIARLSYYAAHVMRPLILIPNANFAYLAPDFCPVNTLNCYFHSPFYRPHRCLPYVQSLLAILPPLSPAKATSSLKMLDPTSHLEDDQLWLMEWPSWTGMDSAFYNHLRAFQISPLATRSHLLLANLRRPLRRLLKARLSALETSTSRYVGVHVRHGDKSQEYPLVAFSTYMTLASHLASTSSISDVYLATDNNTILTTDFPTYPHLHFLSQNVERHGDQPGGKGGYWRTGFTNRQLELFLTSMVDLEMLSRAQVFVGSESSGFTQLVKARRGAEGRWGATWGLRGEGGVVQEELGGEWFDQGVL